MLLVVLLFLLAQKQSKYIIHKTKFNVANSYLGALLEHDV